MKFEHNNISPLDSRYAEKIVPIREAFSEKALIKTRFIIEINWLLFLSNKMPNDFPKLSKISINKILKFRESFSDEDVIKIKKIESVTNHDVKAIEYFIADFFKRDKQLKKYINLIHYGLTSEDINSLSYAIMIKKGAEDYLQYIQNLNKVVKSLSRKWKSIPLLSRTHGQAASPTKLGKEFKVFWTRINEQINSLKNIPNSAKFSGAVGNFNAHKVAYPEIDWKKFGKNFIEDELGLNYSFPTTQIEHYDSFAALCDNCRRINNILLDMCVDIWTYISHDYFKQKIIKDEVGSSAMPHKVNPIDFENSEGNLGLANSTFDFFSNKLTKSRLQRDLTDSTVLRNIGVPFGHTLISFESLLKGLKKIYVNEVKINKDVEDNWIVVSEAIQTILRREGYSNPYEIMKELTRSNERINKNSLHEFIDKLDIDDNIKNELKQISPYNYTGI